MLMEHALDHMKTNGNDKEVSYVNSVRWHKWVILLLGFIGVTSRQIKLCGREIINPIYPLWKVVKISDKVPGKISCVAWRYFVQC